MKRRAFGLVLVIFSNAAFGQGQVTPEQVNPLLEAALAKPGVAQFQLLSHLQGRVTPLRAPQRSGQWTLQAKRLRKHLLDEVIFHGWPREWISSRPRFEQVGVITSTEGYRVRKLRYEIVPDFWSTALLYEPESVRCKAPGIVNLLGHYRDGKAMPFEQKRCINYALQGMAALDLEWIGYGESRHPENGHWFAADLDLVGVNAAGFFFLAMRRGLDFLEEQPNVDPHRLGVTGLSGGGWQTIVLGALDERVAVTVPVAGTCSLISKLDRPDNSNIGDIEEVPTDLLAGQDYSHLIALRAPKPTLMIYNAVDDCCYRAPLTRPYMYDNVLPVFALLGGAAQFRWHENIDPGTHNYELDNRRQSYHFFAEQFGLPSPSQEIEASLKTAEELSAGLPEINLTIVALAKKLVAGIRHETPPSDERARSRWVAGKRARVKDVLRYQPASITHPWMLASSRRDGIESLSYRFAFDNGLSASGVRFRTTNTAATAPITIVLNDRGKRVAGAVVADALNRGEQILALDLLLMGDAAPESPHEYAALLATSGERPLGLEAAQLIGLAKWLMHLSAAPARLRLETAGIRAQTIALAAAALEPSIFSDVTIRSGMQTLAQLIEAPIPYRQAPDLFCLDLFKDFDLDLLTLLARPTRVSN